MTSSDMHVIYRGELLDLAQGLDWPPLRYRGEVLVGEHGWRAAGFAYAYDRRLLFEELIEIRDSLAKR